ncbi:MAG: hypothetical protein AAFY22_09925, partial [Pseudomonadota bacterium]
GPLGFAGALFMGLRAMGVSPWLLPHKKPRRRNAPDGRRNIGKKPHKSMKLTRAVRIGGVLSR